MQLAYREFTGHPLFVADSARLDELRTSALVRRAAMRVDGRSVLAAVARATAAPTVQPLERSVGAHLSGRRGLLVLDNAEHVARQAARTVQLLATDELPVLTTSRRPLGVDGEVVMDVEPLAEPDAVALFTTRAADVGRPVRDVDGVVVAQLCARLDRLPLAIEMAAARLRSLPLQTLAVRLDDRLRLLPP